MANNRRAIKKKRYSGENPICEVKPYVTDQKRREYTSDEIKRIIEAVDNIERSASKSSLYQRYAKRIILFLLFTGMRIGEVLNLKWGNVKDDKIILQRTETKQKKEKVIPITRGIAEILESMKDGRRKLTGYIIPRKISSNINADNTKTIKTRIRELSGIEDFVFHGLRHTASTIMVSEALGKGTGTADIMKILGHSKMETTLKYIHADFDRMKKAVEILEEKALK